MSWDGKTKGGVTGYKIFVYILKNLNIRFAYFALIFVAFYYYITLDKKGIRYYFRNILNQPTLKANFNIYRNFYLFGQTMIDKVAILAGLSKKFTFTFEGEEYLYQVAREKRGALLIGAHIGNWEIAGQLLERINYKVNIVMYDGEQQNIKEYMDNVLEKKIHIIYIRNDDFSYLYEITNALKNKEIIAIHGDRYLPGSSRITCKFMGEDAQVPTGPFYLAAKYNVPVINVAAVKKKATHYDFFATPPKTYPYPSKLKERKKDLRIMVEDYIAFQEKVLKNNSLQWFNYYQFWN